MSFRIILILVVSTFAISIKAQQKEGGNRTVRMLTFNIYHGETMKGDCDLDILVDLIKRTKPDLVSMQEVDFKTNRAKKYDIATELGLRTGMAHLFGRAMSFEGGEYGDAILSRWSFISSRNVALPYLKGKKPRTALIVTVVIDSGDTISFVATHLDHEGTEIRIMQVKKINREIAANRYPVILAGDLNDIQGNDIIDMFEEQWTTTYNKSDP